MRKAEGKVGKRAIIMLLYCADKYFTKNAASLQPIYPTTKQNRPA